MNYEFLDKIESPSDIRKLSEPELNFLCAEIRDFLIKTISKTGGHLASNLGTVELTVAFHRIFNSPEDKLVFDVGHQCYTHKLLTGRRISLPPSGSWAASRAFPNRMKAPTTLL